MASKTEMRQRSVHDVKAILRARLLQKSYLATAKNSCFATARNLD